MRIRAVAEADVPELSELAKRTWTGAFGDSVTAGELALHLDTTRSVRYFRTAIRTDTILVGEDAGALIGYVQFGDVRIPEVDAEAGNAELHRLYVETDRQGGGIGRELVAAALAHPRLSAAPRIYLQVWDQNRRAIALYESFGFRTVGTTRFTIDGDDVGEELVMALVRG